ncbi:MAG TPA: methyltransferase domain-containing protein [Ktedonobacterales bacterium]|jgi:ubiquinone/menaquinone biosynthesis C-methylase UbiE
MNDAQEKKKAIVAAYFGQVAPEYDRVGPQFFATMGQRLASLARLRPGETVLDVATGRGAALFPAAERVGPEGKVIGIDLAPAMIQETSKAVEERKLTQVQLLTMDAERLAFPDASFDAVLCGFALFFFPQLQRALAEFKRVLKRADRRAHQAGGRVVVSTWGPPDPGWEWYDDLLKIYGIKPIPLVTDPLEQPSALKNALRQAGFSELEVRPEVVDVVYADEEEWWARQLAQGTRLMLAGMAPETLERFKADVFKHLQTHKRRDGIHRQTRVNFGMGVRPAG